MSSVQARRQHKALVAVHQAAIIDFIASFADQALRVELMLTPKPGLVDRRNNGAHHDMDLQILLTSARAIASWWPRFVQIGYTWAAMPAAQFLSIVRPAGVLCEQSMFSGHVIRKKGSRSCETSRRGITAESLCVDVTKCSTTKPERRP
jgi:triphosphoribosyl-dephospho-CoA synthase